MRILDATGEVERRPIVTAACVRPNVTVVIPARNEEQVLPRTLPAVLAAAERLTAPTDIVVVAPQDSPMLTNPPVLDERLHWRHVTVPGKYHAIRTGVDATRADVLLLLDADVIVESTTLQRLAQPLLDGRADVCAGRIDLLVRPGSSQATLVRWSRISFTAWDRLRRARPDLRWALPGAVYGIRRSFLPTVPLVSLVDDASVGLHARSQGATFHYEPSAVVRTLPPRTYGRWIGQKLRTRRGWAALARHRPREVAELEATFRSYLTTAALGEKTRHVMYAQDRLLRSAAYHAARFAPPSSGAWRPGRTEAPWRA